MRYPTSDEIDTATDEELQNWYRYLPDPSNDIERRLIVKICAEYYTREASKTQPLSNRPKTRGEKALLIALVVAFLILGARIIAGLR